MTVGTRRLCGVPCGKDGTRPRARLTGRSRLSGRVTRNLRLLADYTGGTGACQNKSEGLMEPLARLTDLPTVYSYDSRFFSSFFSASASRVLRSGRGTSVRVSIEGADVCVAVGMPASGLGPAAAVRATARNGNTQ